MMTALRLLASDNNDRGDLFTRLMSDLFYALGYDNLRFDVNKTGREIDIEGTHRREARRVLAECKAHSKKMGGADLNKFLGVLTRERGKGQPVAGYFVSLGGYSEAGIEQESDTDEQLRVITLDADDVVRELCDAGMLIALDKATERAGRCVEFARLDEQTRFEGAELLGHDLGYVWAVFYGAGKERTHLALVHADGEPLAESVAEQVIDADSDCGGTLHTLTYLAPPPASRDRETLALEALGHYRRWVVADCGYIQLDGLPADTDLAASRMRLEKLFIPLKLNVTEPRPEQEGEKHDGEKQEEEKQDEIVRVGDFLRSTSRVAILAQPGGGKSTLLKRIAVAYADPDRHKEVSDGLPDRNWLPLVLRCRELRDRYNLPIRELLADLGRQAEMDEDQAAAFRMLVDRSLMAGEVLLLVDGLDEFADESARKIFASHLRTFLAMFPNVSLVVTSREAGFRQIAGVIASVCRQTTMAPFDESDVRELCELWHAEVVGDSEAVRNESRDLADTIWRNERIRALAENPLMLTTLLVVRRNVGELPTKRVKLYKAAVDVLVRTWNVEGFTPLDEEETLARLSYVAVAMMTSGKQQIGRRRLLELLRGAQNELEAELQFATLGPNEFIDRIEYRSSLLMQTGHEEIDGEIQEVFEFRHLTFQEYLAARGLVMEQYPDRDEGLSLTELLEPHFDDEAWLEVVPLAAVLANRRAAESLVRRLTDSCASVPNETGPYGIPIRPQHAILLTRCLQDEVQVVPGTLRNALCEIVRFNPYDSPRTNIPGLLRGKFGGLLREVLEDVFFGQAKNWETYLRSIILVAHIVFQKKEDVDFVGDVVPRIEYALENGNRVQRGSAVLMIAEAVSSLKNSYKPSIQISHFETLRDRIGALLDPDDPPLALCICYCLWRSGMSMPDSPPKTGVIRSLFGISQNAESERLRELAESAFTSQPLHPRDAFAAGTDWGEHDALFDGNAVADRDDAHISEIAFLVAWYGGSKWNDLELLDNLRDALAEVSPGWSFNTISVFRMLDALGDPGRMVLDDWKSKQKTNTLKNAIWASSELKRILKLPDIEPET